MGSALLIYSAMGSNAEWQLGLLATGAVSALALVAVLTLTRRASVSPRSGGMLLALRLPRRELVMVMLASCVLALYAGNFHAFLSLFPSYLYASGWSPSDTASLMGILGWAPILMAPIGGLIAARLGHYSLMIAICIFIWGSCTTALSVIGVTPWLIGLMLMFGPLVLGAVMSLGSQAVAPERRGIGSGIFMAGFFHGQLRSTGSSRLAR